MKYNPKPFESLLTRFIAQQVKRIEGLIDEAVDDVSRQARRINPGGSGTFSFRSHPALSKAVDGLIGELTQGISRTITAGTEWSWNLANAKNDAMLAKVISSIGASRIPPGAIERWSQKNLPALSAFQGRKVAGMSLSDRVWAFTRGIKGDIELALDLGLAEGTGADRLSRVVRGYLNEPDRLYRRVRDERGVLHLSKAASNYHPGRGVYRSSYKNAVRLTATETNMAYRSADYERAQQLDFILGIEVHLSNNHTCLDAKGVPRPFYDICDELEGVYPKDFKFVGWHPNCYDDQSEVYTSNGWKPFRDVADDDLILTLNPDTLNLEYSAYRFRFSSWYEGPMVHFYNRSYSQFVTPEHEVLHFSKNPKVKEFRRTPASRCGKSQPIYRSCKWIGTDTKYVQVGAISVPYRFFAEFMGYWLSDGSLGHKWEIGIAQQDEHRTEIFSCIQSLGMKPRYNGGKVEFNNKEWYTYLQQFGKCADKFIPNVIKEATPQQIRIFLDAFISCDGHIKKPHTFIGNRGTLCRPTDGERIYFTSSKRLADDIGELILKTGRRPSFRVNKVAGTAHQFKNGVYANNFDCWIITECHSITATQYNKETVEYKGYVYDLVLEKNATMYIRRNGKCFWGSNCRCYTTTVLPDKNEFYKYLDAMDENGVSSYEFKGVVTDVPRQMTDWLIGNEDRVLRAKSVPYFIKDNPEISVSPEMSVRIDTQLREDARLNRERDNIAKDIIERKDSYTLVERKEIYARPLERQFTEEFADGEAKVYTHLIKSKKSEDYSRVFEVAKAFAVSDNMPVYILPEINAQEKVFRASLGLSTDNGNTPDIMLTIGRFIDVKSPLSEDTISANACKAYRQSSMACITDHRAKYDADKIGTFARWVLESQGYGYNEVYFYIGGKLYKIAGK